MEKETILQAAECCVDENNVEHCDCCPLNEMSMNCGYYFARYIAKQENEPASAGTETSPEVSSNDTNNISHLDDTTLLEICQEALTKISGNYSSKTGNCDFVRGYAKAICDITDKLKNIKEEENANGKQ